MMTTIAVVLFWSWLALNAGILLGASLRCCRCPLVLH
jgi:hypothetical protein